MSILLTKKGGVTHKGVENTTQITFMAPKVPQQKPEGAGNAKVAIGRIAGNVPHAKTNQNLEVKFKFLSEMEFLSEIEFLRLSTMNLNL